MIGFISLFLFLSMMLPGAANTALKFSDDGTSVVSFPVDMSSLAGQFSFCVWVKRIVPGTNPVAFAYEESELFLYASGEPRMFLVDMSLSNKPPMSTWYHYCGTWSLGSQTFKGYINGALVVTQTTAARYLKTSGNMVLGDYWNPNARGATGNHFGGEIFNLNFFSNELTGGEVAAMSKDGLCTHVGFDDYRVIKWEELLTKPRFGNVQAISVDCYECDNHILETEMENIKLELQEAKNELENGAKRETDLNNIKTELENTLQQAKKELENSAECESDLSNIKTELENTKLELQEAKKELANVPECDLQKGKLTRWDVLYSCNFYNKTFTRKLQKKFRSMWSDTKKLFGEKLTDEAIEKFKDLHKQADDNCETD
ncbi:uncharacterized protein LOC134822303 [Bolinopsis microptera]|uniref:uncharacterized protein LOC134822303 n=1 Tax=Bolinopsis microptera TaxID=2820187 RepID=UPI003078EE00